MAKLPAFQFYPADWRKDPAVQSLSYFDRGVWLEILCLMHESEQRGKLLLNGKKMPDDALARLLGLDKQILTKTLNTLLEYGVASIDEATGALFSRRMVRDEEIRQIRTIAGKKGGNPNLVNQNSNQNASKNGNEVNQKLTPSSSFSSSPSSSNEKEGGGIARANGKPPPAAFSANSGNKETLQDYLLRKQLEFPEHAVRKIYDDFKSKCGSAQYPNLKNTQRHFDKWLKEQDVELPPDTAEPAKDRRAAIDACGLCDKNGYRRIGDGMGICKHEENAQGAKN